MIKACTCKHEGQDKIHGKGQRVYNKTSKNKTPEKKFYRCTVCGAEK